MEFCDDCNVKTKEEVCFFSNMKKTRCEKCGALFYTYLSPLEMPKDVNPFLIPVFQPERSKREDLLKPVENAIGVKFSNKAVFTVTPPRCGALNTMET